MSTRLFQIHHWWDVDGTGAVITIRGANAVIRVELRDRTQPIRIDEADKALMKLAADAMLRLGVKPRRLQRRDAQYALWAIAQHLKASVGSMAEQIEFGGLALQRTPLALPAARVTVEARR